MKIPSLKIAACTFSLLIGLQSQLSSCGSYMAQSVDSGNFRQQERILSKEEVCEIAKSRTVLILSEENNSQGTGFLIDKERSDDGKTFIYKVVTNGHVLTQAKSYKIQVEDEIAYEAKDLYRFGTGLSGTDLAILEFESKKNYEIAKLGRGLNLSTETDVIAAGYPIRTGTATKSEWVCIGPGKVSFMLDTPMKGGYSIGYYLDIRKGMSGGPLLNLQGQVVGVNGKHSHPLFGERRAYIYENGSLVDEQMELLKRSSWAIPIETLVLTAKPAGVCLTYTDNTIIPECQQQEERAAQNERSPATEPLNPSGEASNAAANNRTTTRNDDSSDSDRELTPEQLKELASKITVRIKLTIGNEDVWYSGFIVEQNRQEKGYFYKAVTYVGQREVISYSIVKPDGHNTTALEKPKEIIISDGNKLVEIKFFEKDKSYDTANFGDLSALKAGDRVFAAGYQLGELPTKDANSSMLNRLTSEFELVPGNIVSIRDSNDSRIHLSNSIHEEMLGGPLINSQGEVIGINGKHEETANVSSATPNGNAIPIQEYLSPKKETELLNN